MNESGRQGEGKLLLTVSAEQITTAECVIKMAAHLCCYAAHKRKKQSISNENGFKGEHLVQVSYLIPSLCLLHKVITGDILPFILIYIVFLSGFSAGATGRWKLPQRKYIKDTYINVYIYIYTYLYICIHI